MQWLILVVVVVAIGVGYWLLRTRGSTDPWQNMDHGVDTPSTDTDEDSSNEADDELAGTGLEGDSYIVAVRTLTADLPADQSAARTEDNSSVADDAAEASWQAYKQNYARPSGGTEKSDTSRRAESTARTESSAELPLNDMLDDSAVPPEPGPSFAPGAQQSVESGQRTERTSGDADTRSAADEAEPPPQRDAAPEDASQAASTAQPRPEPATESEPEHANADEPTPPAASEALSPHQVIEPQPRLSDEQEIFVIHVVAGRNQRYAGVDIHAALAEQGLQFGFQSLYHRVARDGERLRSVFGVSNMVNPGTLDPDEKGSLSTPGLTLFMVAPASESARATLRDMMETANALTIALGGQVLDDRRAVLTAQAAQYMLDRTAELDRRATLAQRR
ncbi:hypothetical protein HKX41_10160 [Salinisphaera sp. USBA-960]|nr:hypothetical protein [Salifodinibacter halophilus]